jgi:hypothetical protein
MRLDSTHIAALDRADAAARNGEMGRRILDDLQVGIIYNGEQAVILIKPRGSLELAEAFFSAILRRAKGEIIVDTSPSIGMIRLTYVPL